MVSEVRIYVEGGGDSTDSKRFFRIGFNEFLKDLNTIARRRRIRWQIIPCGGRQATYENFLNALDSHPEAVNILLVDSEGSVPRGEDPLLYLRTRDSWALSPKYSPHCHLMVQMMESWLLADIEALKSFYGDKFQTGSLPRNLNIEQIEKDRLASSLLDATRHTKPGAYHKMKHGPKLLTMIDAEKVRKASPHCDRLFQFLTAQLEG